MTVFSRGGSEYGGTLSNSGYSCQVKTASFADRLNVYWERKEGVKDNSRVFA